MALNSTVFEHNFEKIKQVRNILIKLKNREDFKNLFSTKINLPKIRYSKKCFLVKDDFYVLLKFDDKIFLSKEILRDQNNKNIKFFTIRCPNRFSEMNKYFLLNDDQTNTN
jgi:hypothetical protein